MYRIYIKSNKNPRTINTPANGRTYYGLIIVDTREALTGKLKELRSNGEVITDIRTGLGVRIWA